MKGTTMDEQCQGASHSGRSMCQCTAKAKVMAMVQESGWGKDGSEPFAVPLCGMHAHHAAQGHVIHIVTGKKNEAWYGGDQTRSVRGVKSDKVRLRDEANDARRRANAAKSMIAVEARNIGLAIADDPVLVDYLAGIANAPQVRDQIAKYKAAITDAATAEAKAQEAEQAAQEGS